jgi:nucleoside phosphorylase
MGLLHDEESKVVRWALNALALMGTKQNVKAITETIQRHRNDPDIVCAGASALCALLPPENARAELERIEIPLSGAVLMAAAQHSGHFQVELRATRVLVDYADSPALRRAGILIGLDKAPEYLLSSKSHNHDVIGDLNAHPDPIVAQYSIWATYENPALGLKNLRLPLHDVQSRPPNVRKYVYRLASKDVETAKDNYDFLVVGSEDSSPEVRVGLAAGLKDIYFDGMEALIIDWYADEDVDQVKQRLLEHMARNSNACAQYREPVLRAYEAANSSSLTRVRLEAAAHNTNLYVDLKRIEYNAEGRDLFQMETRQPVRSSNAVEQAQRAKVLIVTALPKESAAVLATLDEQMSLGRSDDANLYYVGAYLKQADRRSVIVASAGMGKVNAAAVTSNALRSFPHVEHVIMVGIAGGCPNRNKPDEHVRLGDVVFSGAAGIVEYDFVKETREGRRIRSSPQRPSAKLLQAASVLKTGELMGERPWETILESALTRLGDEFGRPLDSQDLLHEGGNLVDHPRSSRPGVPRVHGGCIGTADTLLKSDSTRDQLRDDFNVRAVEMEASGLQGAAWSLGRDAFVVRGICDYCDEHKNDDWQNYAALAAASYARALVEAMPLEWV